LDKELHRLLIPLDKEATVIVAVSGGADSTALLLACDELVLASRLNWRLVVAHLDHRLRTSSKDDAAWVVQLVNKLGHEAITRAVNVRKLAKEKADNLEQCARRARYEFFADVADETRASLVLTAHTLDDQAETVLLRLLRGSAAEGLAGIEPVRPLSENSDVLLVRPLVSWARRADTERYCRLKHLDFRTDEMNEDQRLARIKVRKQLLPLMQSLNNRVVEALGRSAALLREDAAALASEAERLLKKASDSHHKGRPNKLEIEVLAAAPPAIRRRALRQWLLQNVGNLRRLEMVHFLAVEKLLQKKSGRTVELPNGIRVFRQRDWLQLSVKRVEKGGFDL
jgi:tRNA(Ile)-lysidine synthase